MKWAATVVLLASTSAGVAAAKYEMFARMYKTPHMVNPRGPAILSVRTGFLTSFKTYAAFDQLLVMLAFCIHSSRRTAYPAYEFRTLNRAAAYKLPLVAEFANAL